MDLNRLIGTAVLVFSPWFPPPEGSNAKTGFEHVLLHGVEAGGIWVESQSLNESTLRGLASTMEESTPVIFLPYHKIDAIVAELPKTLLSDELAK